MGDVGIPNWLKGLPLAPEYRPTDTEFADPIAYISKIEKEASAFGICKVIPPLPKPSKKYVLSNLNKSLSKYSELDSDLIGPAGSSASQVGSGNKENDAEVRAVFTTRHQELGQNAKRPKVPQLAVHKQVWQSGEAYTLEQFEVKSKAFARSQLGMIKEISPLVIEALFWKAASEKPIYVEYANDVPGSGFGEPQEPFRYFRRRKRRRKFSQNGLISLNRDILVDPCDAPRKELPLKDDKNPDGETSKLSPCSSYSVSDEGARLSGQKSSDAGDDREGTAGWKLSNSPWNLQVIARSPGSLTRFMPDEIPGVTSPMVYIGMLFSWFAWHVEDHELHSLNFLHVGSPKTWYAVPGDYAFDFEEVVRAQAYGGHVDRLAALALLGEKTTLLSPEVVVSSGIPCCRLVQNPGEFVVTFPRAYHVGFGHGFSCGEAANFGTPQWLKVAKEAAVRRAAMDYLPMLSHQQLLYMLTMSFISRVPRSLLPGARSSRLRDRQKEERELLVKKAFIDDMLKENSILSILLGNESTFRAVLWDPDSLPSPSKEPQLFPTSTSPDASCLLIEKTKTEICSSERETCGLENVFHNGTDNFATMSTGNMSNFDSWKDDSHCYLVDQASLCMETVGDLYADSDDLPCGLQVDSGTLACVACGVLGFPFMSVIQPSVKASRELFPECLLVQEVLGNLRAVKHHTSPDVSATVEAYSSGLQEEQNAIENEKLPSTCKRPIPTTDAPIPMVDVPFIANCIEESASSASNLSWKETETMGRREIETNSLHNAVRESSSVEPNHAVPHAADGLNSVPSVSLVPEDPLPENDDQWIPSDGFLRPRVFCLEHAVETKELLQPKGGANVLVICHTDYEKIKAHAVAVTEEIGNPFRYRDIPLQSASSEDLNLINVSIDDEREESGEDWTSKLGLNLRYCVKARKISSKQEQHALTLGGLFSDIIAGSNASSLKWHRKRSRTQHKLTEANQLRFCNNPQIKGDDMFAKGSDGSNVRTENKIIQYSRRNFNNAAAGPAGERRARGRPRKHPLKEIAVVNDVDLNNRARESEDTPCTIEMVGSISAGLAPSAVPGKQQEIQKTEENLGMTLVSDGGLSNGSLSTAMISVEKFEALVENQIGDKADTKSKICNFMTVDSSEMLHEIHRAGVGIVDEAFDVTNTAGSVSNSIESLGSCKVQTENQTEKEPNTVVEDFSFMDLNDSHQETSEVSDHANLTGSDAIEIPIVGSPELKTQHSIIEENTMEDEKHGYNILDNESNQKFHGTHGISEVAPVSGPIDQPTLMEEFCEVPQEVPGTNDMDIDGEICSSHINAELENACHTMIRSKCTSKCTSREGIKGKREVAHVMEGQYVYNGFIKSPCEGLRPRTQRIPASNGGIEGNGTMGQKLATKNVKRPTDGLVPCKENNIKRAYRCDLEGCRMSFKARAELVIHKRNQCPHEACGKQFSSHRYAMLHQKVHDDDRPLKCPWKGCKMSFKWAWARTEHQRVHTGERPYRCKVTGCGLTFRFVSDFSRHRRKTGHYVNVTTS